MTMIGDLTVRVVTDPKEARQWVKSCGERSKVLAEVELHVFRGATLWIACKGQMPVSYNVTRFGKRRRNIWEPYANCYTLYTVLPYRGSGYARKLSLYVRSLARKAGCRRLKAHAGTRSGLALFASLGDEIWGVTSKFEVLIDTPLVDEHRWDGCVPPNVVSALGAESVLPSKPLTLSEVLLEIGNRSMCYEN